MKTLVTLAVLIAVTGLSAQTTPAAKSPETKAPAPAAKAPAKKMDAKAEKQADEPKIPGTSVARADGTYLGLEVVGGNFKLTFYDKKKKAMAPNVTRATARWPNPRSPGDSRTVLNPSGNALVGSKPVLPPFTFNVYITLLQGEGDAAKAVESFVIPFRG
jgi:hypothetical protein